MTTVDLGPGMIAFQQGDLNGAFAGFLKTLDRDPDNIPVHFMLGLALVRGRSWESALRVLFDVIRIDPSGHHPLNDVAQLDDAIAEAIIGWAREVAASGYSSPTPAALLHAIQIYPRLFRLHTSAVVGIDAGLTQRWPSLETIEFASRAG